MPESTSPAEHLSRQIDELKVPPHSIEAEQAVLGGLMIDNQAWDQIGDLIHEEDFYRRDHRQLFQAINALASENKPYDVVTLADWLEGRDELNDIGGRAYLGTLNLETPSAVNIRAYAEIVHEYSVLRQLIGVGKEIADSAYHSGGASSKELVDKAESLVFQIADHGDQGKKGFAPINQLLTKAIDKVEELFNSDEKITGISSGFADFDNKTSGLQRSDLVIVAGRPSMGKTSFAMNLAENAVLSNNKYSVAVFSMEMPGEQLAIRMMSSLGRVNQKNVRTGELQPEDWPRLTSAIGMLSETRLFIDDTPGLTPTDLRARARRLQREHGLDMIIVDYLQLMQVSGGGENRAAEISLISRSLKSLAKELNVPIIALSQLNRSVEQRPDKRPVMSDLRESGSIEQDADVIIFIYRDEVYNPESNEKGTAEIIIRKQRNGPTGTLRLAFLGEFTRFENLAMGDYGEENYV